MTDWAEREMGEVYCAAWLPNGRGIVFSGIDLAAPTASTYLYNVTSRELTWQIGAATSRIAVRPDGEVIVGGGGALTFWDALTGSETDPPFLSNAELIPAFLPDGSKLLVGLTWSHGIGEAKTTLAEWDSDLRAVKPISEQQGLLVDFSLSHSGKLLAAVLGNLLDAQGKKYHQVYLWDLSSGAERCAFLGNGVTFNPASDIAAIVDNSRPEDETLALYDTETCQYLATLYQAQTIRSPAYSPDGNVLALASDPQDTIRILDPSTGTLLSELAGSWDTIHQLAFSPDGQYLLARASNADRQSIHLWKVTLALTH